MLQDINSMEKTLIQNGMDTFSSLEETNYFELIEVMSSEEREDEDEVIPLGYWLEDNHI